MKSLKQKLLKPFTALVVSVAFINTAFAEQLAPPTFGATDKLGVNIHALQVTSGVDTVAIGGETGLSHRVDSHSSYFLMLDSGGAIRGLNDKFNGSAVYTKVREPNTQYVGSDWRDLENGIYLMRVHDHEGSADFKVMIGTWPRGYVPNNSTPYYYEATGDKRHTLEIPTDLPGQLLWTKPNGTQVWFRRGPTGENVYAGTKGNIDKIVYPNGFTLYFTRSASTNSFVTNVSTNTGYQLKYNYVEDVGPNVGVGAGNTWYENPPENNNTWSRQNPKSVVAINAAIEYCNGDRSVICVGAQDACPAIGAGTGQTCAAPLSKKWPTAKFDWPRGMPRTFFFGENKFKVTDAQNRTTEFRVKAFDKYADANGNPISPSYSVGVGFEPRLMGVKPAGASAETITYTYRNIPTYPNGQWVTAIPYITGLIYTASGITGGYTYNEQFSGGSPNPDAHQNFGLNLQASWRDELFGALMGATNLDGSIKFQEDYRNFVESHTPNDGPVKYYHYDARGNLDKITLNQAESINALYPTTCTNIRTCNQATWISDAKGQVTDYTYHAASGQVESVTLPANKNGIRAKTRYAYTALSATYLTGPGTTTTGTPIWLKTAEKTCINTATIGDACAGNGSVTAAQDEVITRYEYNTSRNLTLKGMTVTAADTSGAIVTKRTCYQYDIYGNRIGETQPKANLASCN